MRFDRIKMYGLWVVCSIAFAAYLASAAKGAEPPTARVSLEPPVAKVRTVKTECDCIITGKCGCLNDQCACAACGRSLTSSTIVPKTVSGVTVPSAPFTVSPVPFNSQGVSFGIPATTAPFVDGRSMYRMDPARTPVLTYTVAPTGMFGFTSGGCSGGACANGQCGTVQRGGFFRR